MTIYHIRSFPNLLRQIFALAATTEIWVIAVFTLVSIPWSRFLPITLVIAAIYWIIRWIAFGRPSVRTPADAPIAILVMMLPISLWVTPLRDTTLEQSLRLLNGILLYYAVANWSNSRQRIRLLLTGLHLAGIVLACSALVTTQWLGMNKLPFIPGSVYERLPLLVSDVVNPNVIAGTLVILLALVIRVPFFAARSLRWFEWPTIVLSLIIMAGVLALTQSRGGLLALGGALITLVVLRWRRGVIVALGTVSIFGTWLWMGDGLSQFEAVASDSTISDFNNRFIVWSRAWLMIQDYPLTGSGMGAFKEMLDTSYPLFQSTYRIPHAHNLVLQVALDLGITGALAWLVTLLFIGRGAWFVYRVGRSTNDAWAIGLGAGLMSSQVALITHGMVDAVTWGIVRTAVLVWALWGLAVASERVLVAGTSPADVRTQRSGGDG